MNDTILESFLRLKLYCEKKGFKGWDPYDGLNSKVLHALLPLKHSALLRLCVIQGFKRCPVNLRPLAGVPKEYNAKGVGLFLQGYCNLYKATRAGVTGLDTEEALRSRIHQLASLLLQMRSDVLLPKAGYHGACWGYNFDWQCRRIFLFPRYTPTVVATCFCATALMEAYEVTGTHEYLDVALSAADFVLNDLHRSHIEGGFLFSYSRMSGNDTVYNASLLGSKLLTYCYKYTGREKYRLAAEASIDACCHGQRDDGAWVYGRLPVQGWVDSFHTGYNLDALCCYRDLTGNHQYDTYIEKGFLYYIQHLFTADGVPKYYDNKMYPIDIHCPGELLVVLHRMHKEREYHALTEKVLQWTIHNMQDEKGYFYYQIKQSISSKISYMRWSNAFMFNAMSFYFLSLK